MSDIIEGTCRVVGAGVDVINDAVDDNPGCYTVVGILFLIVVAIAGLAAAAQTF